MMRTYEWARSLCHHKLFWTLLLYIYNHYKISVLSFQMNENEWKLVTTVVFTYNE